MKFSLFKLLLLVTIFAIVFQSVRLHRERNALRKQGDYLAHKLANVMLVRAEDLPDDIYPEALAREREFLDNVATGLARGKYAPDLSNISIPVVAGNPNVLFGEGYNRLSNRMDSRSYAHFVLYVPETRKVGLLLEAEDRDSQKQLSNIKLDPGEIQLFVQSGWDRDPDNPVQLRVFFDVFVNDGPALRIMTEYMEHEYVLSPFEAEREIAFRTDLIAQIKRQAANPSAGVEIEFEEFAPGQTLPKLFEHVMCNGNRNDENATVVRLRMVDFEME